MGCGSGFGGVGGSRKGGRYVCRVGFDTRLSEEVGFSRGSEGGHGCSLGSVEV